MKTVKTTRENITDEPENSLAPLGFLSMLGLLGFSGLCLLLLMAPYSFSGFPAAAVSIEDGAAYVPPMTFIAITVAACLLLALSGERAPRSRLFWLVFAFCVWCGLSFFAAVYKHDAALEVARIFACASWFFTARILLHCASEDEARQRRFWLVAAIVGGGVVVCGIALFHPQNGFIKDPNFRQFSTFFNPNLLANYCAMTLPFALALLFSRRGSIVVILSSQAMVLILGGLLSTRSKGGLLALAVAVLVFSIAAFKARGPVIKEALRVRRKVALIGALLVVIAGGTLVQKTVAPRLMAANRSEDNSTQFRLYTWQGTVQMIKARPIVGWGPGSFPSAYPQFAITGFTLTAHQVWLQLASESGILASLLLLVACGAGAIKGWRALPTEKWPIAAGGLASITAFLVHGLTDAGWSLISIALLLMITLALLDSLSDAENSQVSDANHHSSLNYLWLGAALLFGIFAAGYSRVVEAETLMAQSRESLVKGSAETALQQAQQASEIDPYSARVWQNRGRISQAINQRDTDSTNGAFEQAAQLQPTKAAHYLASAELLRETSNDSPALYDRAVALDPNDTSTRLARADFLLSLDEASKQRGWQDYEYVAALYDAPYGRYPAIAEMVNFDFVKAFVKLAERALQQKDKAKAQELMQKADKILAVWKANAQRNRDIARESGGLQNFERQEDMAQELEAQMNGLKERMR